MKTKVKAVLCGYWPKRDDERDDVWICKEGESPSVDGHPICLDVFELLLGFSPQSYKHFRMTIIIEEE